MLLWGPPTIVIVSVPLPEKVPLRIGFSTKIGIGAFESTAPHDAVAPASIVAPPDSNPTKNDCMRSVTVAVTKALAGNPVSVHTDGGGVVLEQVCTPGTDDGKLIATSMEGVLAVSPLAV